MFERFTERARQVIVLSQEAARELKHNYIGTEHLFLGLLREEEGLAARTLKSLGVADFQVIKHIKTIIGEGEQAMDGQIPFTPRAKKVLELALREALSLGHNYIGTEHLLLAFMREHEGVGMQIFRNLGLDPVMTREEVIRALSGGSKKISEQEFTLLEKRQREAIAELGKLRSKRWGFKVVDDENITLSEPNLWENKPVRSFDNGHLVLSGQLEEPVVYINIPTGGKVMIFKEDTDATAEA